MLTSSLENLGTDVKWWLLVFNEWTLSLALHSLQISSSLVLNRQLFNFINLLRLPASFRMRKKPRGFTVLFFMMTTSTTMLPSFISASVEMCSFFYVQIRRINLKSETAQRNYSYQLAHMPISKVNKKNPQKDPLSECNTNFSGMRTR